MNIGNWIGATISILAILMVIAGVIAGIRMEQGPRR